MTIKDIAKESGCAIGTVSRVLNEHPDASDTTRAKVLEVVNKYGFVLNQNAKHLKEQQPKTIAVFVKGASSILLTVPGTLKGCKAIGWFIEEYGIAQVSMNVTDINATPVHVAFDEVCDKAHARGIRVTGSEIV